MINYHGRDFDVAVLLRLSVQGPEIEASVGQLTVVDFGKDQPVSDTLIVVPNGKSVAGNPGYDVLAGGQVLKDQNMNRRFKARLLTKQLIKRIEDLSIHGTEMTPAPPPVFEGARRFDQPRERFERGPSRDEFAQGGVRTNGALARQGFQPRQEPPRVERYTPPPSAGGGLKRAAALLSATTAPPSAMAQAFANKGVQHNAPLQREEPAPGRPILRRTPQSAEIISTEPDSIGATIAQALRQR